MPETVLLETLTVHESYDRAGVRHVRNPGDRYDVWTGGGVTAEATADLFAQMGWVKRIDETRELATAGKRTKAKP